MCTTDADELQILLDVWKNVQPLEYEKIGYVPKEIAQIPKGVFRFFWWSAHEDYIDKGSVYLFGRTYDTKSKTFKSCCLSIENLERNLYILPRANFRDDPSKPVTLNDVHDEFNNTIAEFLDLPSFSSREVTRKYVFDPNVPREATYLQVKYSSKYPDITNRDGNTFSRIFGTNQSYLEMVLLQRNIEGPSWLDVKRSEVAHKYINGCQVQVVCKNVNDISVSEFSWQPPPLVVVSLRLKTYKNSRSKKETIIMLSWVVHKRYKEYEEALPFFDHHECVFTIPADLTISMDFLEELKAHKFNAVYVKDEIDLLTHFLMDIEHIDPDLILGHDLLGHDLLLLHSRFDELQLPEYKILSRRPMRNLPICAKFHREAFVGRLLCDLKLSAEQLVKNTELDSLVEDVLRGKYIIHDNWPFNQKTFAKSIVANSLDAIYILLLTRKLGVTSVALTVTNICGNTLNRTLLGGVSEQNECMLLHAFHKNGYIVPDRRGKGIAWGGKSNKSFPGGMVFEPDIGLYDPYVVLMDFVSFYPTIICEYNICPSTFELLEDAEVRVPSIDDPMGVLPKLLLNLMEKRRTTDNKVYKIAFKLTANSLIGYFAYPSSRFYLKYLAIYAIEKGREILVNTRKLIEEMDFKVIYGDTDSIMLQILTNNYLVVNEVAHIIECKVNERYKHLKLEIDGVFKKLLLLKKKKYAAVCVDYARGVEKTSRLYKGLEIMRRDWSNISSKAAKLVLDCIFDGVYDSTTVIDKLILFKCQAINGKFPNEDFRMVARLTKNIEDYYDVSSLHIMAAKRSKLEFNVGDDVRYVVCKDGTDAPYKHRSYSWEDFLTNRLQPDVDYYLAKQVYPVTSRLMAPFEKFDSKTLFQLFCPPKIKLLKVVPVEKSKQFTFTCSSCKTTNYFTKKYDFLEKCRNKTCHVKPIEYINNISNGLWRILRKHVATYVRSEMFCTNPYCKKIINFVPHDAPSCPLCLTGTLKVVFSACDLWKILRFYLGVFDFHRESPHVMGYRKLKDLVDGIVGSVPCFNVDLGELFGLLTPTTFDGLDGLYGDNIPYTDEH